jgi:formylglycine-generating enzyme required for sulfatase activity
MAGNVWEWTRSLYGLWMLKEERFDAALKFPYPYNDAQDGREDPYAGSEMARVLRGGAFNARVALSYRSVFVRATPQECIRISRQGY